MSYGQYITSQALISQSVVVLMPINAIQLSEHKLCSELLCDNHCWRLNGWHSGHSVAQFDNSMLAIRLIIRLLCVRYALQIVVLSEQC